MLRMQNPVCTEPRISCCRHSKVTRTRLRLGWEYLAHILYKTLHVGHGSGCRLQQVHGLWDHAGVCQLQAAFQLLQCPLCPLCWLLLWCNTCTAIL